MPDETAAPNTVRPMPLHKTARAIASQYGDKGAIVITNGEKGIRIGVENLTPQEMREALCVAIHYSFVFGDEKGD